MIHRPKSLMFKAFLVDVQNRQIKYRFCTPCPHFFIISTELAELLPCNCTGFLAGKECIQRLLLLINLFFPIHSLFHLYFLANACRLFHLFVGLIKGRLQIIVGDRFQQIRLYAQPDCRLRIAELRIAAEYDKFYLIVFLLHLLNQFQTVHIRHTDICDHHINRMLLLEPQCHQTIFRLKNLIHINSQILDSRP